MRPILEATGLKAGQDFFLAFSPERIDPGHQKFPTQKVPKVVGGHSPACLEAACDLYDAIVEKTVPVSSTPGRGTDETAGKHLPLGEYRIGKRTRFALRPHGHRRVGSHRRGLDKTLWFHDVLPGPGLGGHCIPIDPFYLSWKARQYDFQTHFIELAGETNRAMPHHVVDKIARALNDHSKTVEGTSIALLGMSYKPDIGDCREGPSLRVAELLLERGAVLSDNDIYVPSVKINGDLYESVSVESVAQADCVVLLTDHANYNYEAIAKSATLIVDTSNAFKAVKNPVAQIIKR